MSVRNEWRNSMLILTFSFCRTSRRQPFCAYAITMATLGANMHKPTNWLTFSCLIADICMPHTQTTTDCTAEAWSGAIVETKTQITIKITRCHVVADLAKCSNEKSCSRILASSINSSVKICKELVEPKVKQTTQIFNLKRGDLTTVYLHILMTRQQ